MKRFRQRVVAAREDPDKLARLLAETIGFLQMRGETEVIQELDQTYKNAMRHLDQLNEVWPGRNPREKLRQTFFFTLMKAGAFFDEEEAAARAQRSRFVRALEDRGITKPSKRRGPCGAAHLDDRLTRYERINLECPPESTSPPKPRRSRPRSKKCDGSSPKGES